MEKKRNVLKNKSCCILYFAVFIILLFYLFKKCRYGFSSSDESFYMTIPYRLMQGDALFVNEWHLSQMASFLIYPIYRIYYLIIKTNEGLLLSFRYIYTAVTAVASIFIFLRLKTVSGFAAGISSLCILIYAPFGVMALSYNSLGIINLAISLVLFITISDNSKFGAFFSGVFFAASVLCCPYLAVLYIIYAFIFVVSKINSRVSEKLNNEIIVKSNIFIWFSIGIFSLAALFLLFVFSRISLNDIITVVPEMFNDPEHPSRTFLNNCVIYFSSILFSKKAKLFYAFVTVELAFMIADKKRQKREYLYISTVTIAVAGYILLLIAENAPINYVMFPVNVLPFFCVLLNGTNSVKRIFFIAYIPAMCYTFFINMTSNQCLFAITSASTVAALFSIVILIIAVEDICSGTDNKTLITAAILILSIVQIGSETVLRFSTVYGEGPLDEQTELIESGVQKGVFATKERKKRYEQLQYEVSGFEENDEIETVLFVSENTWLYLDSSKENGGHSAWLQPDEESTSDRLRRYYELNPDKIPDAVYIEKEFAHIVDCFIDEGYNLEQNEYGNLILMNTTHDLFEN